MIEGFSVVVLERLQVATCAPGVCGSLKKNGTRPRYVSVGLKLGVLMPTAQLGEVGK